MDFLLLLGVAVPDGDEQPFVQVGRKEFERELLIEPRMVVVLNQRRSAESCF